MTNVIDVYVYNGLTKSGDIGMTAAGLYQSVVGLVLVLISNIIARRIDKNAALLKGGSYEKINHSKKKKLISRDPFFQ